MATIPAPDELSLLRQLLSEKNQECERLKGQLAEADNLTSLWKQKVQELEAKFGG